MKPLASPSLTGIVILVLCLASLHVPARAQTHGHGSHADHTNPSADGRARLLTEPGNDVFGTIQEVVRRLKANPNTDWSNVDLEPLRRHLIDMRNFTLHVEVLAKKPLPNGVRLVVQSTRPGADASLERVLNAHPQMLERETGWTMETKQLVDNRYKLKITSPTEADAPKIQGLGYIGLMAYGAHHQRHHWMIATGQTPHKH